MNKFYVSFIPEDLVSIIVLGRAPDNKDEKSLYLFETFGDSLCDCTKKTNYMAKSIFVLELLVPSSDPHLTYTYDNQNHLRFAKVDEIISDWKIALHCSSSGKVKLARNLLNNKSPIEILSSGNLYINIPDDFSKTIVNLPRAKSLFLPEQTAMFRGLRFIKQGDILGSKMQTLINTVNCVGIMGKGIAKSFKEHYPEMFQDYQQRCNIKKVKLGKPYLFKTLQHWIINFPTKGHWRSSSKLVDIENGLIYLKSHLESWGVVSLAIPALGCGNGQLSWEAVKTLLIQHLSDIDIPIEIYEPFCDLKPTTRSNKLKRNIKHADFFSSSQNSTAKKRKLEIKEPDSSPVGLWK